VGQGQLFRKRERAEGDLVWLCWGLALEEQEEQGFEGIPQVGLGRRARMAESRDWAAVCMAPSSDGKPAAPFKWSRCIRNPQGA
jgi:hypothetical protein